MDASEISIPKSRQTNKNQIWGRWELKDPVGGYVKAVRGQIGYTRESSKQSGGHGPVWSVKIRFEPAEEEFVFEEEIFGGAVPKTYIPAVEKGLREAMVSGVLAGYPVVNIKATLYDGSYHR